MTGFGTGYAGDVTASEAYEHLRSRTDSVLFDAPLQAAHVVLPGRQPHPAMVIKEAFVPTVSVELQRRGTLSDAAMLFLSRSGAQSRAAARIVMEQGFTNCLNVAGGFEGPLDAARHRGSGDGWKAQALPWWQN